MQRLLACVISSFFLSLVFAWQLLLWTERARTIIKNWLNILINCDLFFFSFVFTVAVVGAFFICWAPFHAQRLMATYVKEPTLVEVMIFKLLTHISGVTYYISAVINPILYSIMSLKFRQAFKETLGHCCRSSHNKRLGKFNSLDSYKSRYSSTRQSSFVNDKSNRQSLNGFIS